MAETLLPCPRRSSSCKRSTGCSLACLLFLIAAGLTLVFGVMDFINLAHGVQYMLGAYFAVMFYGLTGNFLAALVLAPAGARWPSACCWNSPCSVISMTAIISIR